MVSEQVLLYTLRYGADVNIRVYYICFSQQLQYISQNHVYFNIEEQFYSSTFIIITIIIVNLYITYYILIARGCIK